jgi:hypothetical protein
MSFVIKLEPKRTSNIYKSVSVREREIEREREENLEGGAMRDIKF